MNKEEKETAVKEIGSELEAATSIFAVDYRGISVPQAAELRAKLREADASFSVVKNRLAKRITADTGTTELDEHLVGPTALTYIKGDAVLAAKAIADFIKEHQVLAYKGGLMDGEPLDADQFKVIAKLPGVDALRGQLVGRAATPLTGLVGGLNGLIAGLASQLGQISEQGLLGGDAPAEEPKAPDAAAEEAPAEDAPAEEAAPAAEAEAETSEEAAAEGAEADDDSDKTDDTDNDEAAAEPAGEATAEDSAADEPGAADEADETKED